MTSHYRNTIFAVYLLFCLLATSWSAPSFIRQSTDDFVQQNYQEISSQDSKISASKGVTGLRSQFPSTFYLNIMSFSFLQSVTERYETLPFSVGGYDWTFIVYPKGNTKDGGSGYLSLYLAIENPNSTTNVDVDVRFYVLNSPNHFTIQDIDIWRFSNIKRTLGFSQVLPLDDTFFNDYIHHSQQYDTCALGVDVTFRSSTNRSELFYINNNIPNPRFTWYIARFSTLSRLYYESYVFDIGEKRWKIVMYPNGVGEGTGEYLSLSLHRVDNFQTNEKIYARGKFRVINQRQFSNYERPTEHWYDVFAYYFTDVEYMKLADLNDPSKGFIVNDILMVQVEFEAISSTIYR